MRPRLSTAIGLAAISALVTAAAASSIWLGAASGKGSGRAEPRPADVGHALDSFLTARAGDGFSGAVLARKNGREVLAKGYGLAHREKGQPFTIATVASNGSITKMFTAAAILRLQMEGRLRVTDPIGRFLGNVPADKKGITIHHLLTHTSGWGLSVGRDDERIGRDAYVSRALATPLEGPVGTRPRYSNVAFSMAAAIVELVSGQSYERFLFERFLKPAGMLQTGYTIPDWKPELLAYGYKGGRQTGTLLKWVGADGPGWNLLGNGGLGTTPVDMQRWVELLRGDVALSAEAKTAFFTPHVEEEPGSGFWFAYGCAVVKGDHGTYVFKNGGDGVVYAELRWYRPDDTMFYLITNNGDVKPGRIADEIDAILFQRANTSVRFRSGAAAGAGIGSSGP
jgi:CubicO group peptidase (beta-lactamase class C family)